MAMKAHHYGDKKYSQNCQLIFDAGVLDYFKGNLKLDSYYCDNVDIDMKKPRLSISNDGQYLLVSFKVNFIGDRKVNTDAVSSGSVSVTITNPNSTPLPPVQVDFIDELYFQPVNFRLTDKRKKNAKKPNSKTRKRSK